MPRASLTCRALGEGATAEASSADQSPERPTAPTEAHGGRRDGRSAGGGPRDAGKNAAASPLNTVGRRGGPVGGRLIYPRQGGSLTRPRGRRRGSPPLTRGADPWRRDDGRLTATAIFPRDGGHRAGGPRRDGSAAGRGNVAWGTTGARRGKWGVERGTASVADNVLRGRLRGVLREECAPFGRRAASSAATASSADVRPRGLRRRHPPAPLPRRGPRLRQRAPRPGRPRACLPPGESMAT